MKRDLRELSALLYPVNTRLLVNRKDIWHIDSVIPISNIGSLDRREGILFVAEDMDPYSAAEEYAGINLLLFSDGENLPERADCPELNMLIICDCEDNSSVLRKITDNLTGDDNEYDLLRILVEAIIQNTIQKGSLIHTLTELAGNPVVIMDSAFRPVEATDDGRGFSLESYRINYTDLLALEKDESKLYTDELWRRFLAIPIKFLDIVYGYFLMFERDIVLDIGDIKLMRMLSSAPAIEMLKGRPLYNVDDNSAEDFLLRLISREAISKRYTDKMSMTLGISDALLNNKNYIAVFRVTQNVPEKALMMEFLARDIKSLLNGYLVAVKNGHIVLLFNGCEGNPFSEDTGLALDSFLKSREIFVGISTRFLGLADLSIYYEQAISAVMLFDHISVEKNYIAIQDYLFFDLLTAVLGRKILTSFISCKVLALMDYDKEHGTDMMDILKNILENGCNVKQTAEKMFIHRNTLLYRVKSIESISGLDLKNSEDVFNAQMSFKIISFITDPSFKSAFRKTPAHSSSAKKKKNI